MKSGSPRHGIRCRQAQHTAERRSSVVKAGPDTCGNGDCGDVEMRCLVHVFGGTVVLLGLRVQSDDGDGLLFSRVARPKRERAS